MSASTDRPYFQAPPSDHPMAWQDNVALLQSALGVGLAWMLVFGEQTMYSPGSFAAVLVVFCGILLAGVLSIEIGTQISRMRSCGVKHLDLGPMPRRGERGAALALALVSVALIVIGIAQGRPIDLASSMLVLMLLSDPLGKYPFYVFGRAGVHRLGVRGDFGIFGLFLSWDAIQRAEIDRERPSLLLFSGGSVFRVPLSGVDLDLVERAIPREKLEGAPPLPPSPDIARDLYAQSFVGREGSRHSAIPSNEPSGAHTPEEVFAGAGKFLPAAQALLEALETRND